MCDNFKCYAEFYHLELKEGPTILCRRRLDIAITIQEANKKPDAVIVMMNPGSSSPDSCSLQLDTLIETSSDSTIDVIKDLMVQPETNWNHVRIINLSDIVCSSSKSFIGWIENDGQKIPAVHSIFNRDESEIQEVIENKSNTFIFAWGSSKLDNSFINELATKANDCIQKIEGVIVAVQLAKSGVCLGYNHPYQHGSEKNEKWIADVCSDLKKKTPTPQQSP